MTLLPSEAIDRLEELARAATPGRWRAWFTRRRSPEIYTDPLGDQNDRVGSTLRKADAAFIAEANPATILSLLAEVRASRQAGEREKGEWHDIESAPRDGTPFYARHQQPYRFHPYKPSSEQFRRGVKGRWQAMNEYGGWDNSPPPVGDWKPHPDFARASLNKGQADG